MDRHHHQEWRRRQDQSGHPPFRRRRAHLEAHRLAFPDCCRVRLQQVAEVATRLLLQAHCCAEQFDIRIAGPFSHALYCIRERKAVGHFIGRHAELRADRIRHLTRHQRHRCCNGVTCFKAAADNLQRIGQLFGQFLAPLAGNMLEHEYRPKEKDDQADTERRHPATDEMQVGARRNQSATCRHRRPFERLVRQARPDHQAIEAFERHREIAVGIQASALAQLDHGLAGAGKPVLELQPAVHDPLCLRLRDEAQRGLDHQEERPRRHDRADQQEHAVTGYVW